MGTWQNADGLWVRLGPDEADLASGGAYQFNGNVHEYEFVLNWNDFNNTTPAVPRSTDSFGPMIPAGARLEEIEFLVQTAFTVSAGTVAAGTLQVGLLKNDRLTTLNLTALTAATATGTVLGLGTVGTKTVIRVGSTGAGALLGTTLAEQGVVCAANTTHGTNTYNAGAVRVRVRYFFP